MKPNVTTSTVAANVSVYDKISSDYSKHARRGTAATDRIRAAVREVTQRMALDPQSRPERTLRHLDFGCGPGHVLEWLSDFRMQQVGIDVSLANLRNARQATGALVVCGDATKMPFIDGAFDVVTEASALHHIEDWAAVVGESCRICRTPGGVVLDSEPSREQMAWGPVARFVFELRFPVYHLLSYVQKSKYGFSDIGQAKLNYYQAEIHHQPGTGFDIDAVNSVFKSSGFITRVVLSPDEHLQTRRQANWKSILLNALSLRNPWNPKYGGFTLIAASDRARGSPSSEAQ